MPQQVAIIVVGSTMIDMMTYAVRVPAAGETLVGERFAQGFGGKGANQAVMASRLGAAVAMVNCVGDDVFLLRSRNNTELAVDAAHALDYVVHHGPPADLEHLLRAGKGLQTGRVPSGGNDTDNRHSELSQVAQLPARQQGGNRRP